MGRKRKKYTRAMYQRAQKAIAEMPTHEETVRVWNSAMQEIGDVDAERVLAFEISEDGKVKVEFAPVSGRSESSQLVPSETGHDENLTSTDIFSETE